MLLVIDASASPGTKSRWTELAERHRVPMLVLENAADAAGKPGRKVIAVLDGGFARMIMDAAASETKS